MCNEVACSKATGLIYCNVEWVTAYAILPKPRLTLSGFFPLPALTRSLHSPSLRKARLHLDALWLAARAETSEREIDLRACHARSSRLPSLPQASRSYAPFAPPASTRSLLMPTEQGHSTPSPVAEVARCPSFPASLVADPMVDSTHEKTSLRA